jgi:hypothetical protein
MKLLDLIDESAENQKNQPGMPRMTKQAQNNHFDPLKHAFFILIDHKTTIKHRKCIDFQSQKLITQK